MEFRPCIDIHNGQVKQIVGGSLRDEEGAAENFVSTRDAAFYARLYRKNGLRGGHVILLDPASGEYYEASKAQAFGAFAAYPMGLQAGGGVNPENAMEFLDAGASHVIVTSYVFREGRILYDNLERMCRAVGTRRLVLDLSCKKTGDGYRIVTDRWQKMTDETLSLALLSRLSRYCDEFLVHGVDVEGMAGGIEEELVGMLGEWEGCPVTYAGGIHSFADLALLGSLGQGRVNFTVGSALDIFGGTMKLEEVVAFG